MGDLRSLKEIVAEDLELQGRMHVSYVAYMVRKGCVVEDIWTFRQWQEHYVFPVEN